MFLGYYQIYLRAYKQNKYQTQFYVKENWHMHNMQIKPSNENGCIAVNSDSSLKQGQQLKIDIDVLGLDLKYIEQYTKRIIQESKVLD